ncbi:MAG: 30S ribosomal protein S13 [Candidatus Aminicenantes bacterium]|jgi:small subunit ribosomal protein S13|nr:MAG: 30S ribosomal protein S13 [Candidatus Aminicenantes bacterium]
MARIAGITLPSDKRIEIGLTYIFGIGRSRANDILQEAKIDKDKKVKALTEDEVKKIREIIEKREKIEGDLRKDVTQNIKRLIDISSYRGMRHKRRLPVRGQRTKTNARTRKGPRGQTIKKVKTRVK